MEFMVAIAAVLIIVILIFPKIEEFLYSIPCIYYSYTEPEYYDDPNHISVTAEQIKTYYNLAPEKYEFKIVDNWMTRFVQFIYHDENGNDTYLVPENKREFNKAVRWVEAMDEDKLSSERNKATGNYLRSVKNDLKAFKEETSKCFEKASDIMDSVKDVNEISEAETTDTNKEPENITLTL